MRRRGTLSGAVAARSARTQREPTTAHVAPRDKDASWGAVSLALSSMPPKGKSSASSATRKKHARKAAATQGVVDEPQMPKEKKPKGLMKPPSYPPSVLRPRAHVKAPTDWTAADPATVAAPLDIDPPVSTNVENRGARVPLSPGELGKPKLHM